MSYKTWLVGAMIGVSISAAASAAPVLYSGNGHYYEYVSGNFSQGSALAAASAQTYGGQQGYLATITSQGEQDFLFTLSNSTAWIGAEYYSAAWRWATGPEAGQSFYGTPSPDISYSFWNSGEPNGNAGEPAVVANWNSSTGAWNDWSPGNAAGYYVEFNAPAAPDATTWATMVLGFGVLGAAMRRRPARAFA